MAPTTTSTSTTSSTLLDRERDTTHTKIFVGGLPYHTSDASLGKHFQGFGGIEEAVVITDRQTGKSRGYGFVRKTSVSVPEQEMWKRSYSCFESGLQDFRAEQRHGVHMSPGHRQHQRSPEERGGGVGGRRRRRRRRREEEGEEEEEEKEEEEEEKGGRREEEEGERPGR
ncbi:hypothetical protein CRUP_012104 [Coryphaenoides rupestris]|nr:hypothetical protein CRUP_012104 [Coryphaenoides rupestris]